MRTLAVSAAPFLCLVLACGAGGEKPRPAPDTERRQSAPALDQFLGCYATVRGGSADVRVTKQSGRYFAALREGSGWSTPSPLREGARVDLADLLGRDTSAVRAALVSAEGAPFALLRVDPNTRIGDEVASSGFVLFAFIVGGPVDKVSC